MNCKLCLNQCKDSVSILEEKNDESLLNLIFKYLYLKIQPDNLFSAILCQNCTKNLQEFHRFYQYVQKCQFSFQSTQQVPAESLTHEPVQNNIKLKKELDLEKTTTCKLCMEDCEHALSTITDTDENICSQWINKYLFIKIETDEVHSATMCRKCTKNLQDFHNFFQYVQNCQLTLHNWKISKNETTTTDSNWQSLVLEKETEQPFVENDGHEWCKPINETAVLDQFDEHQSTDKSFTDISVKAEFLSEEEESDACENDEGLEDSKATNGLIELKNTLAENDTTICGNCDTEFKSREMLVKHFKETDCNKKFQELGSKAFVEIKKQSCSVCSKIFSSVNALKRHHIYHHNEKQVTVEHRTCRVCSKVFDTLRKMKLHVYSRHNPKDKDIANRTCSLCSKVFSNIEHLKRHIRTQHNEQQEIVKDRTCCVCSKVFDTISKMKVHVYKRHNPKNEDIANRICSLCSKVFSSIFSLHQHMRYQHNKKQEAVEHCTCRVCLKVFDTSKKMKAHLREQHDKKNDDIANRTCPVCLRVCSTYHNLKQHMSLQHREKQDGVEHRKCRVCSKVFDTIGKMKRHMHGMHNMKNEDIANRTCSICSSVLSTVYGLKQHMRMQHSTSQIEHLFSKVFDQRIQLDSHMSKEHKSSQETKKAPKKQNAGTVENAIELSSERKKKKTEEAKWSEDLQVKEEEPLEIDELLEE